MHTRHLRAALLLALCGGLVAADTIDSRAAELARLRQDVEARSHELGLAKEELRGRLKAIEAQKMEIEVAIRREELRLAQIEGEAASRREELAAHDTSGETLGPALRESLAAVRAEVERGLPFRKADRLAELDNLLRQLDAGDITAETGIARLWAFMEDELRLCREVGMDRQIVQLSDGEVLADVARLGMVGIYFRTDGGVTGSAVREGEGWRWQAFTSRDDQKAVESLFEKLRHGVRSGAFILPNPLLARSP